MEESAGGPAAPPVPAATGTPGGRKYQQELDVGEAISQTFSLFRHNYSKYLVVFLPVEGIIGGAYTVITTAIQTPVPLTGLTPQEELAQLPGYFESLFLVLGLVLLISWIVGSLATATAIRLTSEEIEKGEASVQASFKWATSKLPSVWAVSLLYGIIIFFGFLALYVPGIILGIMFSLALPAVLIENCGVLDSLGRSRVLVGHRWSKTFALFLILGLVLLVAAVAVDLAGTLFGPLNYLAVSLLSALYIPMIPIFLTVYYYSNVARTAPQVQLAPTSAVRFCPSCGEPVTEPNQSFCRRCGNNLRPSQG